MTQITTLGLSLALAIGFATAASAQTTSAASTPTTSTAGNLSTATPTASTAGVKRKPTSATPDMINEAIQRSKARAAAEAATGRAQQWGSEEPFTYSPAVKNFDASQQ